MTDEEQAVCRVGARNFFIHYPTKCDHIGPDTIGACAGRAAFSLCSGTLEKDVELKNAVLGPWLVALLTHSASDRLGAEHFAQLYLLAPEKVISAMLSEAQKQALQNGHLYALQNAKLCWTPEVSERVTAFLDSIESLESVVSGINQIAAFDAPAAAVCALRWLKRNMPSPSGYPVGLYRALVEALIHATSDALPLAVSVMRNDAALERCVWATVISEQDRGRGKTLGAMSVSQLGELLLTLHRIFPVSDDEPDRDGLVTARMSVKRIRDQLPSIIAARESEAACTELLRLADSLPSQRTWLRWAYQNAVTNVRRNLWLPARVDELKQLLLHPGARILNSDEDLLDLVIESLGRLQIHLTGKLNPAAETLWHWDGAGERRKNFRHKDEEALSNCIAAWLANDVGPSAGIVANREVQLRRGSRTDIFVEAFPSRSNPEVRVLRVIIEVKGSWNAELITALETQLVDGYLRPNGLRCGLYLVGWFYGSAEKGAKCPLRSTTLSEAAKELQSLAEPYSTKASDVNVETLLLDCALPTARI